MTPREHEILQRAKAAILAVEPRAEVLLFGSRARGEAHEDSDFDLMILTPEEVRVLERGPYYDGIVDIDIEYGELLSLHFEPLDRWRERKSYHPFLRQVDRDAVHL